MAAANLKALDSTDVNDLTCAFVWVSQRLQAPRVMIFCMDKQKSTKNHPFYMNPWSRSSGVIALQSKRDTVYADRNPVHTLVH